MAGNCLAALPTVMLVPGTYRPEHASDTREQTDGNMRDSLGGETFRLGVHE
jgi:hypothetical protein